MLKTSINPYMTIPIQKIIDKNKEIGNFLIKKCFLFPIEILIPLSLKSFC